ncbi:hypothetical protein WAI453_006527 [Rhynchosporium graminicola]
MLRTRSYLTSPSATCYQSYISQQMHSPTASLILRLRKPNATFFAKMKGTRHHAPEKKTIAATAALPWEICNDVA